MPGRIVEVANDQRHLFVHRGFMVVKAGGGQEVGHVPLDDIAAVIANAHGLSYTNNLLVALAERGIPFVLCGADHNAVGMLWPVDGHFEQSRRMDAQLAASLPTRKRLWASLVRAKLQQQAWALQAAGAAHAPLSALVPKVKSGDPENLEAQGAQRYWRLLFGHGFRRDQTAGAVNALLNYGYTVLRAATARAVVAAGLHPGLGVHHKNAGNAMRLVDDLMEPFRPLVDWQVHQWCRGNSTELTTDAKRVLVHALFRDVRTEEGVSPVVVLIQAVATSLAQVYTGQTQKLWLPPCLMDMPAGYGRRSPLKAPLCLQDTG